MSVFKTREQKVRKAEETRLDEQLAKIRFFPGPIELYELVIGYNVRIIDTGGRDMGVVFNSEDFVQWKCYESLERRKDLVNNGIEGNYKAPSQTFKKQF